MIYILSYFLLNLVVGFCIGRFVAETDEERTGAAVAAVTGIAIPILSFVILSKLMTVGKK